MKMLKRRGIMTKKIEALRAIDYKGRLCIPIKLRKHKKYLIRKEGDKLILEGVD